MLLNISIKNNKLAIIEINETNEISYHEIQNTAFRNFLKEIAIKGVPAKREIFDTKTNISKIVVGRVKKTDPNFKLSLKEFLENIGLVVKERWPEREVEIKKLLNKFPDDNPNKKYILEHLEELPTWIQTRLLKFLQTL